MNIDQIKAALAQMAQAMSLQSQAIAQLAEGLATISDQPTEREQELQAENDRLQAENEELRTKLQAWEKWGQSMPNASVNATQSTPVSVSPPPADEIPSAAPAHGISANLPTNGNGNGHSKTAVMPPVINLESFTQNHRAIIKDRLQQAYEKVKSDHYLLGAYHHCYKHRPPKELSPEQYEQLKAIFQIF